MDWVLDEEQSLQLLEHAYQKGINTWDTVRDENFPGYARFISLKSPL